MNWKSIFCTVWVVSAFAWMCSSVQSADDAKTKPPAAFPEIRGFTNWFKASPPNYRVSQELAQLCVTTPTVTTGTSGPHDGVPVALFVNPMAARVFTNKLIREFPAGSVIVKAKYNQGLREPSELGVMLKHKPGYDPEGGDWEYAFIRVGAAGGPDRGKLQNCRDCHRKQKEHDFVFATFAGEY